MQRKAIVCPTRLTRAQKAEAEGSEEYSMESTLADLSQGITQHKLDLQSTTNSVVVSLCHIS